MICTSSLADTHFSSLFVTFDDIDEVRERVIISDMKISGWLQLNVPSGTPTSNSKFIQSGVQTSSEGEFYCKATYTDGTAISSATAYLLVYGTDYRINQLIPFSLNLDSI